MREIKFRAWDKELKMMVYRNEQTGDTGYDTNPIRAVNSIINEDYAEYIWMQYTGLKDKNGKEIYEGDILKDEYGEIDKVIYHEYMFDLENFYDTGYDIANQAFSEGSDNFEVIGNIYENPELLKEC